MNKFESQLKENAELGADIVNRYLKGEERGSDRVKIGSQSIAQYNRHLATRGNVDAIKFAVGRSISESTAELKKYINTHMPDYVMMKQLK